MIIRNDEDIEFHVCLTGSYEDYSLDEIWFTDPDGDVWSFSDNDSLLTGIITDDDIDQLAYENAYEMEMNYLINKADSMVDWRKEGN